MDCTVRAHSIQLDDETRDYARKKITRSVEKILGKQNVTVDIEISNLDQGKGKPLSRVKVGVLVPQAKPLSVQVEDQDVKAAIDAAADKIWRAVKRNKQKRRDHRGSVHGGPATLDGKPSEEEEDDPDAISAERLAISPLPG